MRLRAPSGTARDSAAEPGIGTNGLPSAARKSCAGVVQQPQPAHSECHRPSPSWPLRGASAGRRGVARARRGNRGSSTGIGAWLQGGKAVEKHPDKSAFLIYTADESLQASSARTGLCRLWIGGGAYWPRQQTDRHEPNAASLAAVADQSVQSTHSTRDDDERGAHISMSRATSHTLRINPCQPLSGSSRTRRRGHVVGPSQARSLLVALAWPRLATGKSDHV